MIRKNTKIETIKPKATPENDAGIVKRKFSWINIFKKLVFFAPKDRKMT